MQSEVANIRPSAFVTLFVISLTTNLTAAAICLVKSCSALNAFTIVQVQVCLLLFSFTHLISLCAVIMLWWCNAQMKAENKQF